MSQFSETTRSKFPNIIRLLFSCTIVIVSFSLTAKDFHVSPSGSDSNSGTKIEPFQTISRAVEAAMPGDEIIVHAGVYREQVNPLRGGTSEENRIVYRAAMGEDVTIKGSEEVKGWKRQDNDTWVVKVSNDIFGDFNPYSDVISGDWFHDNGRTHHTGAVYLNGHWLDEAAQKSEVLKPASENPLWYAKAGKNKTTIWAQFKGVDPNSERVEINARQTVFYPEKEGINFITVSGFKLEHAATPWAPPTAEQIGLIGTHWSKGWIIENNEISYSKCAGVTLGKYGDEFDNKAGSSAEGYVGTINRGMEYGWSKDNIGGHIVRNNHIHHCEQAGIVGSLGAVFSKLIGNEIHDIHVRRLFSGMEMGGIKIHAPIDMLIAENYVHHCWRGIWLDWMAQGTRVTRNLLHDNMSTQDIFSEVNHGPYLVDHNILLSPGAVRDLSQGGAFVHNLFLGKFIPETNGRETPYHKAHSTEVVGLKVIDPVDDRYYNNIFMSYNEKAAWPERSGKEREGNFFGLSANNPDNFILETGGNVYVDQAAAYTGEADPYVDADFKTHVKIIPKKDGVYLEIKMDKAWLAGKRNVVSTELLGATENQELTFVQPDNAPYYLDHDYLGEVRNVLNPAPGPFSWIEDGKVTFKVWTRNQ